MILIHANSFESSKAASGDLRCDPARAIRRINLSMALLAAAFLPNELYTLFAMCWAIWLRPSITIERLLGPCWLSDTAGQYLASQMELSRSERFPQQVNMIAKRLGASAAAKAVVWWRCGWVEVRPPRTHFSPSTTILAAAKDANSTY